MEKWKIGAILALFATLAGFGLLQQKRESTPPTPVSTTDANTTPAPSPFLGRTIGADLPDWNITKWANTARPVPLSSLRGQVALVEAFRIDCSHCQAAAPFLESLYKRYQPRGLKMVAIQAPVGKADNPGRNWQTVQAWVKERGLTYPVGLDEDGKWFLDAMKGQSYPTTLVLNKTGEVVSAHTGFNMNDQKSVMKTIDMAVELERLLPGKEPLPARSQSLAKWLAPLTGLQSDPAFIKSFAADLEQRLAS